MPSLDIFGFRVATLLSSIGNIQIDAVLSEVHKFPAAITENPVEDGTVFSDHVILLPVEIDMECRISNASLSLFSFKAFNKVDDAYRELVKLQRTRVPFTVVTGLNQYENMLFKELSIPRIGTDGQSIRFNAVLKEILVVGANSANNRDRIANDVKHTALQTISKGLVSKELI